MKRPYTLWLIIGLVSLGGFANSCIQARRHRQQLAEIQALSAQIESMSEQLAGLEARSPLLPSEPAGLTPRITARGLESLDFAPPETLAPSAPMLPEPTTIKEMPLLPATGQPIVIEARSPVIEEFDRARARALELQGFEPVTPR